MGPFATMIMQIASEQNFSDQGEVNKVCGEEHGGI
jgi:hypothetical protein